MAPSSVGYYNGSILAGQKVTKTENGETTEYTLAFMYDNNGDVFGFLYNGEPYYYVKNAQNDVTLIMNADCIAVVLYQYDAWGNVTQCFDGSEQELSAINPLLYRSYYYDMELGMYYLNSRYYFPTFHRFLNADGMIGANQDILGSNLFAYCSNDPINFLDEMGCGRVSNWLKSLKEKVVSWWNRTPTTSATIPSSHQLTGTIADIVLGATSEILQRQIKNIPYGISSRGTVRGTPWATGSKYPKATKAVNRVSVIIAVATLTLDIGNTWTEQNNNTNGKRMIKTAVQLGGAALGVGVGCLASVAFAACAAVPAAGVVAFAGITILGTWLIDVASNKIYETEGIE